MKTARALAFGLAFATIAASSGCSTDPVEPEAFKEIGSGDVHLAYRLNPFELRIVGPGGRDVLRTTPGGGDTPYGAAAATRDEGEDATFLLPGWDGYHAADGPWSRSESARLVESTPSSLSFEMDAPDGVVSLAASIDGTKVTLTETARSNLPAERAWNKMSLAFALRPDEHFFGLGERYASVDHRGLSLYSWAEEGALGQGEGTPRGPGNPYPNGPSMTYFPVPFLLSSAGYGLRFDTTYRTETHFGSEQPDAWRAATNHTSLSVVVYVHEDPLASLDDYTRETGRPFVPASWVFGPRRRSGPGSQIDGVEEYRALRSRGVPTTGIDDAIHFLPHRSELGREEELRAWTQKMHAWGFKVIAYNNPYISTTVDASASDLAYGKEKNLFAKTPEGAVGETFIISGKPQNLATIDLLNPEGVAWFQDLLRRTLALGYDGWMHDFGEYVRRPWVFHGGKTGEEVHNLFPVLSAKAAHDLLVKERPNDFLFFVRSGYAGTQAYVPAVWGGDPEATFDETQGLPAMLRGGINLGMSGVPLWGSDVTGFKCMTDSPRDKEIHLRWAQVGAISPIMMQQDACANPVDPSRKKWRLWDDEETIAIYGAMARLHTRLSPYWDVLARAAHDTGVPIMRHPFLLHPREPEAWAVESAFYLGPSLWAAPVVARGERTKNTWLPPGRWVDLDDRAVYEGGKRVDIPAPLAKLPLLLKDGGIVPMLDPSIDTLAPATEPSVITPEQVKDRLDVVVALSAGREARITLADGTELVARRVQASTGNPASLALVSPEQVGDCPAGCVHTGDSGGVAELRVTTAVSETSSITYDDVVLEARGPFARRVRWDVLRLR